MGKLCPKEKTVFHEGYILHYKVQKWSEFKKKHFVLFCSFYTYWTGTSSIFETNSFSFILYDLEMKFNISV